MNCQVKRHDPGPNGVFGFMFPLSGGNPICCTLERTYPINNIWVPKIPLGTYTCKKRMSPHFGYLVFQVMDVPGHDFIELHIANYASQLDGCIALGEQVYQDTLLHSKDAFDKFMALQSDVDEFTLVVS